MERIFKPAASRAKRFVWCAPGNNPKTGRSTPIHSTSCPESSALQTRLSVTFFMSVIPAPRQSPAGSRQDASGRARGQGLPGPPVSRRPDLHPDGHGNLVPASARMKQMIAYSPAWRSSTGSKTPLARAERDMSSCTRRFVGRPDPARNRTMPHLPFSAVVPAAVWLTARTSTQRSLATVPAVKPGRDYGGRHGIARLPNRLHAKCVPDSQAGR